MLLSFPFPYRFKKIQSFFPRSFDDDASYLAIIRAQKNMCLNQAKYGV